MKCVKDEFETLVTASYHFQYTSRFPAHDIGAPPTQEHIAGKHPPRDSVFPLEDPIAFNRPTRPDVEKPRRVVQLNSSKTPIKPSFPSIPGFNPLKGDFIRGGLIRVVSIPPEQRLTAAPIAAPLKPSMALTKTFQLSVRPIRPDVVRRQQEIEVIEIITPAPEPTSFPSEHWPTSWTSWTTTTQIMGFKGEVELVVMEPVWPWKEPVSPIRNGNSMTSRKIPGQHIASTATAAEAMPVSAVPVVEIPRSSNNSADSVVIESPRPPASNDTLGEEQEFSEEPDSEEASHSPQGLDRKLQNPEEKIEPIRKRERIQKRDRRSKARKD
ncbi:hypothetical protein TWF506_006042 [Arthrobotrys conoides]|uniref:Uncharacterized protein n=1 Tax=Arthrobotrys conoides TaxID=74498 RepID=A0AAN8NSN9_9PEZI